MNPRQRLAVALLWLTPALWSSNYLIARAAAGVIAPHLLATLRWSIAAALLLTFAWRAFAGAPRGWWRSSPAVWWCCCRSLWPRHCFCPRRR